MYTKSVIQQIVENCKVKDNFRAAINNLMEKYNIEDSVFVLKNGFLHEAVGGYFVELHSLYTYIVILFFLIIIFTIDKLVIYCIYLLKLISTCS